MNWQKGLSYFVVGAGIAMVVYLICYGVAEVLVTKWGINL